MNFKRFLLPAILLAGIASAGAQEKLSGEIIGSLPCVQYTESGVAYDVDDIRHYAFDGNPDTYYATKDRSYTWVGLDLGKPHVITRVGWAPRNGNVGPRRMRTGIIQGANSPDFLDALPIYIIREDAVIGRMTYADVDCSKGFRYVRFVSTGDNRCNIGELEFYGTEGEGDDSHLFRPTNLATVIVNTVDAQEPYDKEHNIACNVIILDENGINVDKSASIRERGNASRQFPKKPWRIKFDKKQNVLDAPAKAKKWTLINNYGDKTLMRNIVAFEIARRLEMSYVPYCRPVDVILNGEYKGCYQLCDQVEINPGRLDITEMEPDDIDGEALTGGYLFEIDGYAKDEPAGTWFYTNHFLPVTVKSPDLEDEFRQEQYDYLRNYLNEMEARLYSGNFNDPATSYRALFDIDSFLRHFIVGELTGNPDTFWSTYMYKDRNDDVIHTGPVWDFDIAFDNDYRIYPTDRYSMFLINSNTTLAAGSMKDFSRRIIYSDPQTPSDITRIWSLARNDHNLTPESLLEFINQTAEVLNESQDLNFKRWPILNEKVHMNPVAYGSYEGEVDALRNFITTRFTRLDPLMGYDKNMSGITDTEVSQPTISVSNGCISLDGRYDIYGLDGCLIFRGEGTSRQLPAGLYIIRTAGQSQKIIIR